MAAQRFRIGFHWLTVILVSAAYAVAIYREGLDDPEIKLFWLDCHRTIGLVVLALTALRLIVRKLLPFERPHETGAVLRGAALLTHVAIYLGLIAMPLLGWAQSSAKARKFKLFDMPLPALVKHDGDLAGVLSQWHEGIGWALLGLIAVHSAAALFHHFVRKDTVLLDMLRVRRGADWA